MRVAIKMLVCKKCGHKWFPRSNEVRMCPKCKSVNWNKDKQDATIG